MIVKPFTGNPGQATRLDIRNTIQCPLCRRMPLQDCKGKNGINHRERYEAFMKTFIPGWKRQY